MRIENTGPGQIHLSVEGGARQYIVPGAKTTGSIKTNGWLDIPESDVALVRNDPAQNAAFVVGLLVEVPGNPHAKPGSPALTNPSGNPEDVAKIEAAAAAVRAEEDARAKVADEIEEARQASADQQLAAKVEALENGLTEAQAAPEAKVEAKHVPGKHRGGGK